MANESDYPAKYQLEDGSGFYLLETGTDYYIKEAQNYAELVVTDGAICYFRFNETSGNFTDIIGGRIGTPTGSIAYAQTGALVGDPDTSVGMSTADTQYVTVTGEASLTAPAHSNNLTFETWVSVENNVVGEAAALANFVNAGANTYWSVYLKVVTAATLQVIFSATDSTLFATLFVDGPTLDGTKDRFHHVVCQFDAANAVARVYVDGAATTPQAYGGNGTPITYTSGNLLIGSDPATDPLKGRIDEWAIYPTVLTAAQIARHYRCGIQFLPDIPPPVMLAAH